MIREEGYYWVKEDKGSEWQILQWSIDCFWACGYRTRISEESIYEIDPKPIKREA